MNWFGVSQSSPSWSIPHTWATYGGLQESTIVNRVIWKIPKYSEQNVEFMLYQCIRLYFMTARITYSRVMTSSWRHWRIRWNTLKCCGIHRNTMNYFFCLEFFTVCQITVIDSHWLISTCDCVKCELSRSLWLFLSKIAFMAVAVPYLDLSLKIEYNLLIFSARRHPENFHFLIKITQQMCENERCQRYPHIFEMRHYRDASHRLQ